MKLHTHDSYGIKLPLEVTKLSLTDLTNMLQFKAWKTESKLQKEVSYVYEVQCFEVQNANFRTSLQWL